MNIFEAMDEASKGKIIKRVDSPLIYKRCENILLVKDSRHSNMQWKQADMISQPFVFQEWVVYKEKDSELGTTIKDQLS